MKNDKENVIAALLTSDTKAAAAKKAGISDKTLRNYFADPAFKDEYQRRKQKLLEEAANQIQKSMKVAISTLNGIIQNEESRDSDRISASRLILEFGLKYTEITDILSRIEELERDANG